MELTGGGVDTFEKISAGHIANLRAHLGLEGDMSVGEIGRGIGRNAIPLADILTPPNGRYLGIDIVRPSIDWCSQHISKRYPHVMFAWFDAQNTIFNPTEHCPPRISAFLSMTLRSIA